MEAYAIAMLAVAVGVLAGNTIYLSRELKELEIDFRRFRSQAYEDLNQIKYTPVKDDNKNLLLIKKIAEHLDLKVVEETETFKYNGRFGETYFEETTVTDRRIEPKTDNEKRIEELQKEIEILKSLDKE